MMLYKDKSLLFPVLINSKRIHEIHIQTDFDEHDGPLELVVVFFSGKQFKYFCEMDVDELDAFLEGRI